MEKPLIAITCRLEKTRTGTREYRLPEGYVRKISSAGGMPVIVGAHEDSQQASGILSFASGLVLTGGGDLDPSLYGAEKMESTGEADPFRDTWEIKLVLLARQMKMPVLGICRGIQVVNVALGGSLYQDLQIQDRTDERHKVEENKDRPCHKVIVSEGSRLHKITGRTEIEVNSTHHQAVCRVGNSLVVSGVAKKDKVVEALESREDWFLLSVQWHPERLSDPASSKLFAAFVDAAREFGLKKTA